jgi:hypothetical protein
MSSNFEKSGPDAIVIAFFELGEIEVCRWERLHTEMRLPDVTIPPVKTLMQGRISAKSDGLQRTLPPLERFADTHTRRRQKNAKPLKCRELRQEMAVSFSFR